MGATDDFLITEAAINDLAAFSDLVSDGFEKEVTTAISDFAGESTATIDGQMLQLFSRLDALVFDQSSFEQQISNAWAEIQIESDRLARELLETAQLTIEAEIATLTAPLDSIALGLGDLVEESQTSTAAIIQKADDNTETLLTTVIKEIDDTVTSISTTVVDTISPVFVEISDLATTVEESTKETISNLAAAFPAAIEALPDAFGGAISSVFSPITGPLGGLLSLLDVGAWAEASEQIDEIWSQIEADPDLGELVKILTPGGAIGVSALGIAGMMLVGGYIFSAATGAYFAGKVEKARQGSFKRERPGLLTVAELQQAGIRDLIQAEHHDEELSRQGFTETDQAILTLLAQAQLNIPEVMTLWHRGIIDIDEAKLRLGKLGIRSEDIPWSLMLSFAIPGIQDIILFAVREVFDVETAEKFGQFEGVSPEAMQTFKTAFGQFGQGFEGSIKAFEEYAKQAGLSPQWATAYWAAHWRLPGVRTLFEMVHRLAPDIVAERAQDYRDIGLDPNELGFEISDLQRTLRANDFSPFFREKLTALSYTPLTRVDIRRMHKLGLLDDDQVTRRYRERGFSPADAKLMTAFTVDYNQPKDDIDDKETKDLTRSNIISFFESDYFNADEATSLLIDAGYDKNHAEFFIGVSELKMLQKNQTRQIKTISERFKADLIGFNEAVTELDALELPALRRDEILADFEAEKAQRVRFPSKSELDKLAEGGQLGPDQYYLAVRQLGFDNDWTIKFTSLIFDYPLDQPYTPGG